MADNKKYITRGAIMACEHGSKRILLNIPEGHGVYVGWQPIAHCEDCKPEENILSFGSCSSPDYHKSSKLDGDILKKIVTFFTDIGQDCLLDLLPQWFICDETQYIMPCTEPVTPLSELSKDELKKIEDANVFSEVTRAKSAFTASSTAKEDILSADEVKKLEETATTASKVQAGKTLLTMDSVLVCRCGGVIKFLTSGQEYVDEEMLKRFGTEIPQNLTAKTPEQLEKEKLAKEAHDQQENTDLDSITGSSSAEEFNNFGKGDYKDFLTAFGQRESRNNYSAVNEYHYMGKYQLGYEAMRDLKLVDSKNCWLPNKWDVYSEQDFLDNKNNCQEDIKKLNDMNIVGYLKRMGTWQYVGQTIQGVEITESGLIAATNLLGIGDIKKALSSGNLQMCDANGATAEFYLVKFKGYDMSDILD